MYVVKACLVMLEDRACGHHRRFGRCHMQRCAAALVPRNEECLFRLCHALFRVALRLPQRLLLGFGGQLRRKSEK